MQFFQKVKAIIPSSNKYGLVVILILFILGTIIVMSTSDRTSNITGDDATQNSPADDDTNQNSPAEVNPENLNSDKSNPKKESAQQDLTDNSKKGNGYLTISEWNIKVPLTERTRFSTYKIENSSAYLYVDIDGDNNGSCSNQALIYRYDPDNSNQRPPSPRALSNGSTNIDNIQYVIEGSQSGCTTNPELQSKATLVREEWLSQSKSIERN